MALAREARRLGHEIVWSGEIAPYLQQEPWLAEAVDGTAWEVLLDTDFCDGIIVGRGDTESSQRVEQLLQLVKQRIPVFATFPLTDSLLSYYEIDMARSETACLLQSFNPLVEQTAVIDQCRAWVEKGHPELGRIEQILWERPLENRSRQTVLWHFARDVQLLDAVAGRLYRLGAHGSPNQEATYTGLSVQLLGESNLPIRWEVGPVQLSEAARLTLIAERGKLCLEFDDSGTTHKVQVHGGGKVEDAAVQPIDAVQAALARFLQAVSEGKDDSATWPEAVRAMEMADTIEISLRRGRMIDVHHQQLTEQLSFKGTMSALGCGVLLLLPPLLLLLGWLAELLGIPLARYWPHALLGLLALFLLLQVLPRLLMSPSDATRSGRSKR